MSPIDRTVRSKKNDDRFNILNNENYNRFETLYDFQGKIIEENKDIVNQLTELNKHNPEKIQNEILEENRTTNNELAKLNKNLSKETKSAKKK